MHDETPTADQRRQQAWNRAGEHTHDVLVIGGGIVGAGVARDAALRGLRTALVEQRDFAFGTSSRSSRLLHGGIRYLAKGEIHLVREASREKQVIHTIAPHLAHPLAFIFPSYRGSGWPKWQLRLGVKVYDLLCGGRNLGRSQSLGIRELKNLLPELKNDGLRGAVRYFDGKTCDARLVLDTLRSAETAGAALCNYARLIKARQADGHWICTVQDELTGKSHRLLACSVVNATGPWSDRIPGSRTHLRITKGVHLVIDRLRLPVPDAVVLPQGKRILFAIPWGERTILGTTDTDYDGPLESPSCDTSDAQYVLDVVNDFFPTANIKTDDVISAWSGLRPLVADSRGDPSDISRSHEIMLRDDGWCDITGGKLTTYRLMAEQTIDQIVERIGLPALPCRTAATPLLAEDDAVGVSGIVPPEVAEPPVRHYVDQEWARSVDDVMTRRTGWRFYHAEHAEIARQVAVWMAPLLGWDQQQQDEELQAYLAAVEAAERFRS